MGDPSSGVNRLHRFRLTEIQVVQSESTARIERFCNDQFYGAENEKFHPRHHIPFHYSSNVNTAITVRVVAMPDNADAQKLTTNARNIESNTLVFSNSELKAVPSSVVAAFLGWEVGRPQKLRRRCAAHNNISQQLIDNQDLWQQEYNCND
uniref:Uncharacterized protein n=1 Tax=Romanomermis culicivorax TaxID=13658 RepID=A0A915HLJ3_ROMCU